MPKLLHTQTFIQFFELDKGKETEGMSPEATYKWLIWRQRDITEDLRKWAEVNYPNTPKLYHCCFAGLVAYFATGGYGGYGTEAVQKERYAEQKAYQFYAQLHRVVSEEQMTIAMIYFIVSHLLQKPPLDEEVKEKIADAINLLEDSKSSFKSKQIAKARKILEGI